MCFGMKTSRPGWVRWTGIAAAAVLLLALVAWLALRLAGAHQLRAARSRFEAEVGPLPPPAPAAPAGSSLAAVRSQRERALLHRLGAPARLPASADLARIRPLLWRAPSTWSPAEVGACRSFLVGNASLLAACDRAAEHGAAPSAGAGVAPPWDSVDPAGLVSRANADALLMEMRVRLALHDRRYPEMRRAMAALATEAAAFDAEPGMLCFDLRLQHEKALLRAMAWVVEDPGVEPQDLAWLRRLLPLHPVAVSARWLVAGQAGFVLASWMQPGRARLSDAEAALLLDGYRRVALDLTSRRGVVVAASFPPPRTTARYRSLPAAILALTRPSLELLAAQAAALAAAHQLAELALDLRLAAARTCAYPARIDSLAPARIADPFTAALPRFERDARGGALLWNPSAAAAWPALPHCAKTKPPPYVWRLPPLPCTPAAPAGGS